MIEAASGEILDPSPPFLDQERRVYVIQNGGVALYRDEQHLTTNGAKMMSLPLLHQHLRLKGWRAPQSEATGVTFETPDGELIE